MSALSLITAGVKPRRSFGTVGIRAAGATVAGLAVAARIRPVA